MAKFEVGGVHAYIYSTDSTHPSARSKADGPATLLIHAHGCFEPTCGTFQLPAGKTFYFDNVHGRPADQDGFSDFVDNDEDDFRKLFRERGTVHDYYLFKYRTKKGQRSKAVSEEQEATVAKGQGRFDVLIPRNKSKDKVKELNTGAVRFSLIVNAVAQYRCYENIVCSFCRVTMQEALNNYL